MPLVGGLTRLGSGVIDVLDREVEFLLVMLGLSAKLGATVREHATDHDLMHLEERHHPVSSARHGGVHLRAADFDAFVDGRESGELNF
jgi:hypothetical protein